MNSLKTLQDSGLFRGFAAAEIGELLDCLGARRADYRAGEMVLWEGDRVTDIGIVLSGAARSIKMNAAGDTTLVTLVGPGDYLGVLLAASRAHKSPVSVQAVRDLGVLFIPAANIVRRCAHPCERHDRLLSNLLDGVAEMALALHERNDCLICKTVREKTLSYLMRIARKTGGNTFTIPLDRSGMAEYLNVERSALSRELSRMKRDGLIDYYKNSFKLL